jgi:hypothetical protein
MNTQDLILSITDNGMTLIYNGSPLCNDKQTIEELFLVAKMYKCDLPATAWNGIRGEWVNTHTIEEKND